MTELRFCNYTVQLYFKMTLTNVSQDKNVKEFFQLFPLAVSF